MQAVNGDIFRYAGLWIAYIVSINSLCEAAKKVEYYSSTLEVSLKEELMEEVVLNFSCQS